MSRRVLLLAAVLAVLAAVGPSALVTPAFACLYDDPAMCDGPATQPAPAPPPAPADPTADPSILVPALDDPYGDASLQVVEDEPRCVVVEPIEDEPSDTASSGDEAVTRDAEASFGETSSGEACEDGAPPGSRCREVERSFRVKSGLFGLFTLYRFHALKHFCFDGRRVSDVFMTEWTDDRLYALATHVYERARGHTSSYFPWNGNPRGGHWSVHWAKLEGCVLRYGCLNDYNPRMEIRNYANGETRTRIVSAW